jgi:hypothetical protein
MRIVYYAALVPTSLILRARRRTREPGASTYWISRQPLGTDRGSVSRQF